MVLLRGSGALMVNPTPFPDTGLLNMAGVGERVILVGGTVQDTAVVIENILCAVAVVDVPVDDGNTVHLF